MKYLISILLVIIPIFFISSCSNPKPDKKSDTQKDTTALTYNEDSASEEIAVIIFNQDGQPEYIKANPEDIFRKTNSGLEYRFVGSGKGKKYPKVGDVLYIDMTYKTEKDSVLFRSREIDKNFKMRLEVPSHPGGCIEQAFMMMKEGDSAVFKIDAVNFLTYTQGKVNIPHYIKKGDKLIFNIKMMKIVDGSEYVKENADMYAFYINQENSLIDRYLLSFDYQCVTKESGLRIMTIKKGSGKKALKGNAVTIHYTAGFIDGSVFDSTIERNQPFRFVLGKEEVIEGLDEGVSNMNIGDHCIFIIPFRLAYGDEKSGIIPPYSTLVFEVELIDAK
ncbi:MAG TPA: FKBP-type peptidyl-prolyl cis-trans isomerase [Bacteroidales bacterium]|nr:FKBP-type peptidyl-prolyl cis-trans isomerase [Bacteroidales bacterium]